MQSEGKNTFLTADVSLIIAIRIMSHEINLITITIFKINIILTKCEKIINKNKI